MCAVNWAMDFRPEGKSWSRFSPEFAAGSLNGGSRLTKIPYGAPVSLALLVATLTASSRSVDAMVSAGSGIVVYTFCCWFFMILPPFECSARESAFECSALESPFPKVPFPKVPFLKVPIPKILKTALSLNHIILLPLFLHLLRSGWPRASLFSRWGEDAR